MQSQKDVFGCIYVLRMYLCICTPYIFLISVYTYDLIVCAFIYSVLYIVIMCSVLHFILCVVQCTSYGYIIIVWLLCMYCMHILTSFYCMLWVLFQQPDALLQNYCSGSKAQLFFKKKTKKKESRQSKGSNPGPKVLQVHTLTHVITHQTTTATALMLYF